MYTGIDRGASNLIGVLLLVAIVVLLAAAVGSIALGFQDQLREPVIVGEFETEYAADGGTNDDDRPFVNITYLGGPTLDGDDIVIEDGSGNSIAWNDVWTGGPRVYTNEYVHIDGNGTDGALDQICREGQTYTVEVHRDGSQTLVEEWTAPHDPDLPAGSSSDDDGDGIPNWCEPSP